MPSNAKLYITKESHKLVMDECVKEFRRHHPDFDHVPISQDKIVFEIARYYLEH